jgi:hypothetical protein
MTVKYLLFVRDRTTYATTRIKIHPNPTYSRLLNTFFSFSLIEPFCFLLHFPIISFVVNSQRTHTERKKENNVLGMFDLLIHEKKKKASYTLSFFTCHVLSFLLSIRFSPTSRFLIDLTDCTYIYIYLTRSTCFKN